MPQAGMPLIGHLLKQLRNGQIACQQPCLRLVAPVFVAEDEGQVEQDIGEQYAGVEYVPALGIQPFSGDITHAARSSRVFRYASFMLA